MSKFKKRASRIGVGRTTHIIIGNFSYDVEIIDISFGGVLLQSTQRPELGTEIELKDEQLGAIKGKVVRHCEEGFAIHADENEKMAQYALKSITFDMIKDQ
jgi:hypothetical protein